MSKLTLDQLKAAFTQPKTTGNANSNWKHFYPFWKMEIGEQAVVRFLPDLNAENPMGFLVENMTHRLEVNGQRKDVPCLAMYGEHCPCCEEAQKHYALAKIHETNGDKVAQATEETLGKKYYKKREYIGQVLVLDSPIEVDEEPVVKLISIGPKIFKLIQAAFASGDLEEAPYELQGGYDFRIIKSKQGDWADYTLSKFAPKQTNVSEDMIARLDLFDLSEQRTRKIDGDTMQAMLTADLTGSSYVGGSDTDTSSAPSTDAAESTPSPQTAVASVATTSEPEAEVEQSAPAASPQNDILAEIRKRAAAKKQAG